MSVCHSNIHLLSIHSYVCAIKSNRSIWSRLCMTSTRMVDVPLKTSSFARTCTQYTVEADNMLATGSFAVYSSIHSPNEWRMNSRNIKKKCCVLKVDRKKSSEVHFMQQEKNAFALHIYTECVENTKTIFVSYNISSCFYLRQIKKNKTKHIN